MTTIDDSSASTFIRLYAQLGDKASALKWLAKAEKLRDPGLQSLRAWWSFEPIRGEPEFKAVEVRMNFPP
jgi:hypothetical protein